MATWRELISCEMNEHGDDWDTAIVYPSCDVLDIEFDDSYGGSEGAPFTLWTQRRVYFPAVYDGSEWCASVARHPDGVATSHIGGE